MLGGAKKNRTKASIFYGDDEHLEHFKAKHEPDHEIVAMKNRMPDEGDHDAKHAVDTHDSNEKDASFVADATSTTIFATPTTLLTAPMRPFCSMTDKSLGLQIFALGSQSALLGGAKKNRAKASIFYGDDEYPERLKSKHEHDLEIAAMKNRMLDEGDHDAKHAVDTHDSNEKHASFVADATTTTSFSTPTTLLTAPRRPSENEEGVWTDIERVPTTQAEEALHSLQGEMNVNSDNLRVCDKGAHGGALWRRIICEDSDWTCVLPQSDCSVLTDLHEKDDVIKKCDARESGRDFRIASVVSVTGPTANIRLGQVEEEVKREKAGSVAKLMRHLLQLPRDDTQLMQVAAAAVLVVCSSSVGWSTQEMEDQRSEIRRHEAAWRSFLAARYPQETERVLGAAGLHLAYCEIEKAVRGGLLIPSHEELLVGVARSLLGGAYSCLADVEVAVGRMLTTGGILPMIAEDGLSQIAGVLAGGGGSRVAELVGSMLGSPSVNSTHAG